MNYYRGLKTNCFTSFKIFLTLVFIFTLKAHAPTAVDLAERVERNAIPPDTQLSDAMKDPKLEADVFAALSDLFPKYNNGTVRGKLAEMGEEINTLKCIDFFRTHFSFVLPEQRAQQFSQFRIMFKVRFLHFLTQIDFSDKSVQFKIDNVTYPYYAMLIILNKMKAETDREKEEQYFQLLLMIGCSHFGMRQAILKFPIINNCMFEPRKFLVEYVNKLLDESEAIVETRAKELGISCPKECTKIQIPTNSIEMQRMEPAYGSNEPATSPKNNLLVDKTTVLSAGRIRNTSDTAEERTAIQRSTEILRSLIEHFASAVDPRETYCDHEELNKLVTSIKTHLDRLREEEYHPALINNIENAQLALASYLSAISELEGLSWIALLGLIQAKVNEFQLRYSIQLSIASSIAWLIIVHLHMLLEL
jgi:hypothetical protein